jgi:uncharacterized protein YggE
MHLRKAYSFALPALLGASLFAMSSGAFAADERLREAIVTVSGEGRSTVAPDTAIVTLSVVRQAKTAQEALADNNKAMDAVATALKAGGVAERDLQTSGFSIQQLLNFPSSTDGQPQAPQVIGYQATNTLTARVRDLAKLGSLIDQAVTLGVNQGGDVQFINDKPEAAINDARKQAVADAIAKAGTLAQAAGVKLGRIVEINENPDRPMPQPIMRATMMKAAADSAVPIQAGENTYHVTVNVTYALEQ